MEAAARRKTRKILLFDSVETHPEIGTSFDPTVPEHLQ